MTSVSKLNLLMKIRAVGVGVAGAARASPLFALE